MRIAAALSLALGAAALAGPAVLSPARAAPTVTIKSRTQITLEPVQRRYGNVVIRGHLTDQFSDEPVEWAFVTIRLGSQSKNATTDADGLFEATFRAQDGKYDVRVEYPGGDHYTQSSFEIKGLDVAKGALKLSVHTDNTADYKAEKPLAVAVKAWSELGGPAAVRAELYAGEVGEEQLAHMGSVTTDDDGRATFDLDIGRLGAPGNKRVEVRFSGDYAFNPAEAHQDFLLATGSTTTLEIDDAQVDYESKLRGTGKVADDSGLGVPRAPVAMLAGTRRVAETLTDVDGEFVFEVAGSEIGAGKINVQAVFEPTKRWRKRSRSDVITLDIAKPEPIPIRYTLTAFACTALAMLAFVGLRTKPWERLLGKFRRVEEAAEEKDEDGPVEEDVRRGLLQAKPSLVAALRRAHDHGFSGTVRDAITGRPVANAHVTLTPASDGPAAGHAARESMCDARGQFAFEDLADGEWHALVRASTYCSERFQLHTPHRGELRGAKVDILPVRERVFEIYRGAALLMLPKREFWGIWTPRQIFDHVRSQKPARSLSSLTDFVEETYFSQRSSEETILPRASELAEAAKADAPRVYDVELGV